ncbi:hypothetical protein Rumeso_01372 [Rubellimicrobium mesophilum DSM 19309]|uniref:Uncharacterized protein n=1 Tax=Rubellimicrobium mesophilum DSM 19309 TaxID=442562 RepID=A0A017HSK4_9RHOB|nr:AAA family ATPase [Rubellimicrobium mesophilum]EYD77113.1 hypothetical protein Rumeso_01372 [Rubellimicrobium mesophilum DSM 19309]
MNLHSQPLDVRSVAAALGGEVNGPDSVLAPGPGHGPKDRSLSVKLSADKPDGFTAHSFAGDDWRECRDHVAAKLGLPAWTPRDKGQQGAGPRGPVAEYVYHLADGAPYLKVERIHANGRKIFPQFHWTGSGWAKGKPKGPKVPYRLPELLDSPHAPVLIAEGEKDADSLHRLGLIATTASEGAGKWTADLGRWFKGRTVYILPDNDQPGHAHANQVAGHLHGIAAEVRIVALPGLPAKGDVSDWIAADGDVEELLRLCEAAPVWTPESEPPPAEEPSEALAPTPHAFVWRDPATIPPVPRLYGLHLIRRQVSVTVAPSGLGKSSNIIVEGLAIASGRDLLGEGFVKRLRVWIINLEDPIEELERRVTAAMIHHGIRPEEIAGHLFLSGREDGLCTAVMTREGLQIVRPALDEIEAKIRAEGIDVASIDPFISSHQVPENDNGAIDKVAKEWAAVATRCNCAIEIVHHTRKLNGEESSSESGRGASSLVAAARSGRVLARMTEKERAEAGVTDDPATYFSVLRDKTNQAPPGKRVWRRIASVDLGNGDMVGVGVVERWTWPDTFEGMGVQDLLAVQRALDGKGARYSDKTEDWAGHIVAETLGLDAKDDKKRISKLIDTWIGSGALVKVDLRDAKRNLRPCVEVGEWATE